MEIYELTSFVPYEERMRNAAVPVYTLVQFRDDKRRDADEIGIVFPYWGSYIIPSGTNITPDSLMDFVLPIYHSKDPLTFEFTKNVYTQQTHNTSSLFIRRMLQNTYTKTNAPDLRKYSLRRASLTQNPLPFANVSWDEKERLFFDYHEPKHSKGRVGSLMYQLTGKLLIVQSSWVVRV